VIVVGVDAHSETHTAAAVDRQTAQQLAVLEVRARAAGHLELLEWAGRLGAERVWAIEDCRQFSGGLERLLLEAGEQVLRVPPKLMADQRRTARSFGKSDPIDALAAARAAIREPELPVATLPGLEYELGLLVDHREALVLECVRHQRRLRDYLHRIDRELLPALRGMAKTANLNRLSRQLARMPQGMEVRICRELIGRVRELAKRILELAREIAGYVRRMNPELLSIPGCGIIRRPDPGRGRRHRAVRHRSATGQLRRRRPAGCVLGAPATPPPQSRRQPPAQPGALHHRGHPDACPSAGARLPRPRRSARQDQTRSAALAQAPPHPRHLPRPDQHPHPRRSSHPHPTMS
jgi:transposase